MDDVKDKRVSRPQIAFTLDAPGDEELLLAWKQAVKFRMKKDYKERFRELMKRDVAEFKK